MKVDEIREALTAYRLPAVAKAIGVSHVTLWRFAAGRTKKVDALLVEALTAYLERGVAK